MENLEYTYNGLLWTQALTVPDENSFFHAAFGCNEDEVYYDKHAKVRRLHWAAFLTYYQNESMPPLLLETLKKSLLAHEEYKHIDLEDKDQFEKYVSSILATDTSVALEEIPILAALENVKVTVLLDKKGESAVVTQPNPELLGNYKIYANKPREVFLCVEEQTFSKLEPMNDNPPAQPQEDELAAVLGSLVQSLKSETGSTPPSPFALAQLFQVMIKSIRTGFLEKKNPYGDPEKNDELSVRFEQCLDYIRTLALENIFDTHQCGLFSSHPEADETIKEDVWTLGIVEKLGSRYHFVNKHLMEFFVGQCLVKELELGNSKVEFQKFLVEEVLSKLEYTVTRSFFSSFLQSVIDSVPSNALQNYLSDKTEGEPRDSFKLLYLLCCEGCVDIIRLLFKCLDFQVIRDKEADIKDVPRDLRGNSLTVLQYFLRNGGVNIRDDKKTTPLHVSVQAGQAEVIKFLVQQGADVNCKDDKGASPLHLASKTKLPIVKVLVELGADINAPDRHLSTPLHYAAQVGAVDIVRFLVDRGANLNALAQDGFAPIHSAAIMGRWDAARLLVELGADFMAPGSGGSMLVNLYASRGQLDLVRYLAGLGADLNVLDDLGDSSLSLAVSRRHLDTLKCLVELGADVNLTARGGNTPLHMSAMYGYMDFVEYLVEHGADVGAKARGGHTVLHIAARGNSDMVKYFVRQGVDVNGGTDEGLTPLHYAAANNQQEVIKFLVGSGADASIRSKEGKTALEFAEEYNQAEAVTLLRELGGVGEGEG